MCACCCTRRSSHSDHPVPSGDREMARGLRRLLLRLGHAVVAPAAEPGAAGVPPRRRASCRAASHARAQARRLIARWRGLPARHPERFDLWFTYHCYYRKPDWLGPIVSGALGIPYVIAEASHSLRRAQGTWRAGPSRGRAGAGGGRPRAHRQSQRLSPACGRACCAVAPGPGCRPSSMGRRSAPRGGGAGGEPRRRGAAFRARSRASHGC